MLLVMILAVVLALSSTQGVFAEIVSVCLKPECGPRGTYGTLIVRYTGSHPTVQTYPDLGPLGGDVGEGVVGIYFTVPEGVHQITFTIVQDDVPARTVVFCPTSSPVGGFMEPVNKFTVFAPYLVLFGVIAAVTIVVVKPWKKYEN